MDGMMSDIQEYEQFLNDYIGIGGDPDHSYYILAGVLNKTMFDVRNTTVTRDINRIRDALGLRARYFDVDPEEDRCTMYELLISLAIRICTIIEYPESPRYWFFKMISNLWGGDYTELSDEEIHDGPIDRKKALEHKLNNFVLRKYNKDGTGGLFPLKKPKKDQRKVEIWYQMQAYLIENLKI